jgi:hypothetical protein
MVTPALTCGSEIWKKEGNKIYTTEMKLLSSVAGYTRKDQMRNN